METRVAARCLTSLGVVPLGCLLILTLAASASGQTAGIDYGCRTLWAPRPVEAFTDISGLSSGVQTIINNLVGNGIMTGCGPGQFCPYRPVTREEIAFFVLNARHRSNRNASPIVPPTTFPAATGVFADVPVEHPMACWIEQFYAEGLTSGCALIGGKRYYCPQEPMTRAQMAVFILGGKHAAGWTLPACNPSEPRIFCDVPDCSHWAAAWIEQLWLEGITSGCAPAPNRQYCPENYASRWEVAVFLDAAFIAPPPTRVRSACTSN
ncbi:MAG: S-layer homology domain-containing protein [Thermoanaerobaculaceae bacterium]|nr:S-layer homology domain-containing protein [Thermoanaerobaculaceae bacterium]